MDAFSHVTGRNLVLVFAYLLLLSATAPKLAHYSGFAWGMVPVWLVLVAYVASVFKNLSTKDRKEHFDKVMLLALLTYFAVCLVWPFPLKWYDSLLFLSLFAGSTFVGQSLQMAYYMMSAASYMHKNKIVQVSARLLIVAALAVAVVQAYEPDADETT